MFSEHNQAIDIVVSDIWMVVNKLTKLRLKTSMEETNGILVIEVIQSDTDFLKQGNILFDRSFLS